ncbi:MAG TPA: acyl-CoA dehydrogenase family protein [Desulfomonilia bacterium]
MKKNLDGLFLFPQQWVDVEARRFAATARQWADKEIISRRLDYQKDYDTLFTLMRKKLMDDIGFERLVLPEENGGYGWNSPASAPGILTVFTEIGRADAAIGFTAAVKYAIFAVISMKPNIDKDLCDKLAPLYCGDTLKNIALILPSAGSAGTDTPLFHGRSIGASLRPSGDGFILNGSALRPVGPGYDADLFGIVAADTGGKTCLAFIPADLKGVIKDHPIKTTGLNGFKNTDVTFKDVRIPGSLVVMRNSAINELYCWLNLLLGGTSLGATMNFFEILSDWSENRTIKGSSIMKDNPLCASVLAAVADEIACVRLNAYSLAHIMASSEDIGGPDVYTFAQMLGSRIQQSCMNAINRGMELMGSAGYSKEWHVEKHWRDIKTIQSYLCGTGSDVPVKMDIARFFFDLKEV